MIAHPTRKVSAKSIALAPLRFTLTGLLLWALAALPSCPRVPAPQHFKLLPVAPPAKDERRAQ
jgi:hypothetical protein